MLDVTVDLFRALLFDQECHWGPNYYTLFFFFGGTTFGNHYRELHSIKFLDVMVGAVLPWKSQRFPINVTVFRSLLCKN